MRVTYPGIPAGGRFQPPHIVTLGLLLLLLLVPLVAYIFLKTTHNDVKRYEHGRRSMKKEHARLSYQKSLNTKKKGAPPV